jgi:hypothetical protein
VERREKEAEIKKERKTDKVGEKERKIVETEKEKRANRELERP